MTKIDTTVVMDWQLSSYFGWGVYGINLMLNWSRQEKELLLTNRPVNESVIDLNPIEWALIRPALEGSRDLQARLESFRGQHVSINFPVLRALADDFIAASGVHDVKVSGSPSLGLTFFASTLFSAESRERAKSYPLILAGSSWNQAVLDHAGIGPTALALQGVDPTAFHPAPKAGWFAGRFAVFSGGKLEYRKGQDLVLKAFRVFADRHPDAVLVTAWASPWPDVARSLNADPTLAPVSFRPDGRLDVPVWAAANGISPRKLIDLGALPNSAMPRLYREMDVGLFPNRCEGGTNLVAMECMACSVPVILSRNTGHLDLIAPDCCFPLEQQSPIDGADHLGWGESDVEEIVETLEAVRRDRAGSLARAERGAAFMSGMTWADTTRKLTEVIEPYL
jgi:glycosyltransferase involved in cell wall biosynthesis